MRRCAVAAALIATVACVGAEGRNLITDGSGFETGQKNIGVTCSSLFSERVGLADRWRIDSTTAAEGRKSLCLNLTYRGRCAVRTRGYVLQPGKKYTLSFFAKADKPVSVPVGVSCVMGFYDYGLHKTFRVGEEWQRYSVTGTLSDTPLDPRMSRRMPYRNRYYVGTVYYDTPNARIWLDGLQLEEGGLTPYAPGRPGEINITPPGFGRIFHVGNDPGRARILVHTTDKGDYRVDTVLRDSYHDRTLATKTLAVQDAAAEMDYAIPGLPRGHYHLRADLLKDGKRIDKADFFFAFITAHTRDQAVPADKSFLGVHHGPCSQCHARGKLNPKRDLWSVAPPDYTYGLLRDLGIHWQRNDCLGPSQLAGQDPGEVHTSQIEPFARYIRQTYGVKLMSTIFHATARTPEWIRSDTRSTATNKALFDLRGVALYTRALVESAPSIDCWETANEPNCEMSAREFYDMNKVVYETIKSVNPKATVVGFSTTGDLGANVRLAFREASELKTAEYVDVISTHGHYGDRPLGTKDLVESCRRDGSAAWNTELRIDSAPLYDFPTMEYIARNYGFWRLKSPNEHAAASIVLYMDGLANGIGRTFVHAWWYPGAVVLGAGPSWIEYDLSPRPIIPAVDAFTALVDGAAPRGTIDLGGDNRCFMVEKDGRPVVLLQTSPALKCRIPLPASKVEVLDLMGNPVTVAGEAGAFTLELPKGRPLYLVGKGVSCEAMKKALLSLPPAKNICRVRGPRLGLHRGKPALTVRVTNIGATAGLSGRLTIGRLPGGLQAGRQEAVFRDLALRASQELFLPVRLKDVATDSPVELALHANGMEYRLPNDLKILAVSKARRKISIDGEVSDWNLNAPHAAANCVDNAVPLIQGMPWRGVADCSARLYAVRDDRNLYLLAVIKDDTVMVDPAIGKKIKDNAVWSYETDCLELFFDTDLMKDFWARRSNADDLQFMLAPAVGDYPARNVMLDAACRQLKRPFTVATKRTSDGYVVEAEIPFATLGDAQLWKRKMIGFNFAVDDDDTPGRQLKVYSDKYHFGRDIQMKWSGYGAKPVGLNIPVKGSPLTHRLAVSPIKYGVMLFE